MSTVLSATSNTLPALAIDEQELISVLTTSLYPGAAIQSIKMVLSYCKAAGLDPMQKPVHIVPMWDGKTKQMRDVVMPGIGLYRTQAARSERYAGVTEPVFGEDVSESVGGVEITYPKWCSVSVKRVLDNGTIVEFSAKEFWKENYATKGRDSAAPNSMWQKRPYGQLAKCAEAQALRKAFPELGAAPTAEEMEGKIYEERDVTPNRQSATQAAEAAQPEIKDSPERNALIEELEDVAKNAGTDAYAQKWSNLTRRQRVMVGTEEHERLKQVASMPVFDAETVHG